jgi:hypothetical protein
MLRLAFPTIWKVAGKHLTAISERIEPKDNPL